MVRNAFGNYRDVMTIASNSLIIQRTINSHLATGLTNTEQTTGIITQLVRQLNLFFAEEEFEAAVDALPGEGAAKPRKRSPESFADAHGGGDVDVWAYVPPGEAPPGFR